MWPCTVELFQRLNRLNSKMNVHSTELSMIYRIASNYGLGVYFFPVIINQATK